VCAPSSYSQGTKVGGDAWFGEQHYQGVPVADRGVAGLLPVAVIFDGKRLDPAKGRSADKVSSTWMPTCSGVPLVFRDPQWAHQPQDSRGKQSRSRSGSAPGCQVFEGEVTPSSRGSGATCRLR